MPNEPAAKGTIADDLGLTLDDIADEIARGGLNIGALKLRPKEPVRWASDYFMPIYNDNRMFLNEPKLRKTIVHGFSKTVEQENISVDVIAGTSTAGIPWGMALADKLQKPFIYIRDKPKDHGLKNQIEGIDAESDIGGKSVVVIEDLISTGGSSAKAVQAVRDANGRVEYIITIFNYGFKEAAMMFEGKASFDKDGKRLTPPCKVRSLLWYDRLIKFAEGEHLMPDKVSIVQKKRYMSEEDCAVLKEWRPDPFNWGFKHGWHWLRGKDTAQLTEKEEIARKRSCLALDVPTTRDALALADGLSDLVGMFKIGKQIHSAACNEGVPIVPMIYERGGRVFLDLKLKDTPQTAYEFVKAAIVPGVEIVNLHCSADSGEKMVKEAIRASHDAAAYHNMPRPKMIGVTVLTSVDENDLKDEYFDESQGKMRMSFDELVFRRAELARKWGLDGIVCPANKAGELQKRFGEWLYVTPGIEWGGKSGSGQKQLYTPDRAVQDCKYSILVLGSAVTKVENKEKRAVAREILKAMAPYV